MTTHGIEQSFVTSGPSELIVFNMHILWLRRCGNCGIRIPAVEHSGFGI